MSINKMDKGSSLEDAIEIGSLHDKTESAYEDIVNMALKEDAEDRAIEDATGVKALELGVDVETPQMRDKQRQAQMDNEEDEDNENKFDHDDDDHDRISIKEKKLSELSNKLTSIMTYDDFEKEETKNSGINDSFDISESYDLSDINLPVLDQSKVRPVMDRATFLKTFKNIINLPSITEISMRSTRLHSVTPNVPSPEVERIQSVDPGHFVDPLTGELLEEQFMDEKSITPDSTPSILSSTSSESNIILLVDEDEEILIATQKIDQRDQALIPVQIEEDLVEKEMAAFLEEITKAPSEVLEIRLSDLLRQQRAEERSKKLIQEFLDTLIGRVVYAVEYVDPETVLRKNLDKSKLLDKLVQFVLELRVEQGLSALLNRKVAEHYRRKKAFRNITEVNVDNIKDEIRKYYHQMDNLDVYLGYENDAIENKRLLEQKLQNQLQELTDLVDAEIETFEGLVRNTFLRLESSERFVQIINILLKRMRNQRNEVKEYRRDLIYKQSMIAQLHQDLTKLDNLGEGLHLSEYNDKLTETKGLTKLLDEKEFQTSMMRKRCHESLHTVTHMMENISMEKSLVSIHLLQQKKVQQRKVALRQELYQLKLQHLKMIQETKQLHYQGGLIGKTSILLDYDKIVDAIPVVKKRIQKLKSVHDSLTEKVKILGKKCGSL